MKNNSATALTNQINKVLFDFQLSSSRAHFTQGPHDGTDELRIHDEAPHLDTLASAPSRPLPTGSKSHGPGLQGAQDRGLLRAGNGGTLRGEWGCSERGMGVLRARFVLSKREGHLWEGRWNCRRVTPNHGPRVSRRLAADRGPGFARARPAPLHGPLPVPLSQHLRLPASVTGTHRSGSRPPPRPWPATWGALGLLAAALEVERNRKRTLTVQCVQPDAARTAVQHAAPRTPLTGSSTPSLCARSANRGVFCAHSTPWFPGSAPGGLVAAP